MSAVRIIALGNEMACDDGAAMDAVRNLETEAGMEVILAGRPGPGLLDLLDPSVPTVLVDVVRASASPGSVVELPLEGVRDRAVALGPVSSHGLGPAQALDLARALGRTLPTGHFVGIAGQSFGPGTERTPEVTAGLEALKNAVGRAARELMTAPRTGERKCTSTG